MQEGKRCRCFQAFTTCKRGKNVAEAAAELCMSRSWGIKWYKRYQKMYGWTQKPVQKRQAA
ncbi:MAG: hypothetical protein F4245_06265 [Cenarchaeum sp. SB0678_bin_8]|nr:hypothetical protein [Cenarchaeum sp. SB0678_bin_8]